MLAINAVKRKGGWLSAVGSASFPRKERPVESGRDTLPAGGNVSFNVNHLMRPQQLVLGIDTLTHSFPTGTRLATKNFRFQENQHSPNSLTEVKKEANLVTNRESQRGRASLYEVQGRTPAQAAAGARAGMGTRGSQARVFFLQQPATIFSREINYVLCW